MEIIEDNLKHAIQEKNLYLLADNLCRNPTMVINYDILACACTQDESAAIRLLLNHPTTDPNIILDQAMILGNDDIVISLLESEKIKFSAEIDLSFSHACGYNRINIISLLLNDHRLIINSGNAIAYLCTAIRNGALETLKLLCEDKRFDLTIDNYKALRVACLENKLDCVKYLMDHKSIDLSTEEVIPFEEAIESCNEDIFGILLKKSKIMKVPYDITKKCFEPSKMNMFRVLVEVLTGESLENLLQVCITKKSLIKIQYIHSTNRLVYNINYLLYAIREESTDVIKYFIEECKIDVCISNKCGILCALGRNNDLIAQYLINADIRGRCPHSKEVAELSIDNKCWHAAKSILSKPHMRTSITNEIIAQIINKKNSDVLQVVINNLSGYMTSAIPPLELDQYKWLKLCIENNFAAGIKVICLSIELDLSWNNYELIRLGCKDNSSVTLDAFFLRK